MPRTPPLAMGPAVFAVLLGVMYLLTLGARYMVMIAKTFSAAMKMSIAAMEETREAVETLRATGESRRRT